MRVALITAVLISLTAIMLSQPSSITINKASHEGTSKHTDLGSALTVIPSHEDGAAVTQITPSSAEAEFDLDPSAIESLRHARLHGDPRAPKLSRSQQRVLPTKEELDDYEQYLEYEQRQKKQVYRAYVEASKIKVSNLQNLIEEGRLGGVSEEQIAQAEEKLKGIETMAEQLKEYHPDIMEDDYQPQQGWLSEQPEADSQP